MFDTCAHECTDEYSQSVYLLHFTVIEDPSDTEEQALKEMYDEERVLWLQDYYHKSGSSLRTCKLHVLLIRPSIDLQLLILLVSLQ